MIVDEIYNFSIRKYHIQKVFSSNSYFILLFQAHLQFVYRTGIVLKTTDKHFAFDIQLMISHFSQQPSNVKSH